jgi:mRNA interferase RelE/StbE
VEILPSALKELKALPQKAADLVDARIRALAANPRPQGYKSLKGKRWKGLCRIRSGNYRVIYEVRDDRLIVAVIKIGDRKDVYD